MSPRQARELFPLLELGGVVGAAWIEGDGYVDPASLTSAYAAGASARRRHADSRRPRDGHSHAAPPRHDGRYRCGRDRRRMRDQRGWHVGRRNRGDGRHARAGRARSSISIWSRRKRTGFPPACHRCATPTATSTSSRKPARSLWAAGNRTRDRGARTGSRGTSARNCCSRISSASRRWPKLRRRGFRSSMKSASGR